MTVIDFDPVCALSDHFTIIPDTSEWAEFKDGRSLRTTPFAYGSGCLPSSDYSRALRGIPGIYALSFQHATPAIYVGTSFAGRMINRIQSHRTKATGSADRRVVHGSRWQDWARKRHGFLKGKPDVCADAKLMIGRFPNDAIPTLDLLLEVETQLVTFDWPQVCARMLPGVRHEDVWCLSEVRVAWPQHRVRF